MVNQTLTKPIGLIGDLKIHIHGILYVIMMKNNVLDASYSMVLGCPWLRDAKVTHDWENNLISIEGNGTICPITKTKHLDNNTKHLEVFFCYNFVNGVTNEEEDMLLVAELNLFIISTIILSKLKILVMVWLMQKSIQMEKSILMQKSARIPKLVLIQKLVLIWKLILIPHILREISIDITLTWIKVQDMKMAKWNLLKEVQIFFLNLGTHDEI